jgi:hypothetical protein
LAPIPGRYTYRFLFVPGTIGAIAWLFRNQAAVKRIKHGLVLACAGDRGELNYKRSRRQSADIDRAVAHVLNLVITESTVKVHMKAILRKLRLQNRTQAAIWARNNVNEDDWNLRAASAGAAH